MLFPPLTEEPLSANKCSVTLISVIRLESLITFAHTKNLTCELKHFFIPPLKVKSGKGVADILKGDYVQIGYWSTIEADVGVICACLPSIRGLFRRIWPRIFGDTAHTSSKASKPRSMGTGSRLEGGGVASSRHQYADDHFLPLVDMDSSSQSNLANPGNKGYTKSWVAT
jgi:hypothetical protein